MVAYFAGILSEFVVVGDFNGDGIQDLAVLGSDTLAVGTVSVLQGNGDGTFRSRAAFSVPGSDLIVSFAAGDFNGDGLSDLAVPGRPGNTIDVLLARSQTLSVPLRWTALRGSPAESSPGDVGEPDTDNVLWRRHERASDRTWIPGARITFRSAVTGGVRDNSSFPLIDDPHPPSAGGPGQLGDVLDPAHDDGRELKDSLHAALTEWTSRLPAARGPIALNLRSFVDASGNPTREGGRSGTLYSFPLAASGDLCRNKCLITVVDDAKAFVAMQDNSFRLQADPNDSVLAHQLGHFMNLGHGNGLDDDGDGVFDDLCDPAEGVFDPPLSIMSPDGFIGEEHVTTAQREAARGLALKTPGSTLVVGLDTPVAFGETIAATRTDTIHEVADESADLTSFSMSVNTLEGTLVLAHGLFGLLQRPPYRFHAFMDLDGDPATGGEPSVLGLPTGFLGAELVTRVDYLPSDPVAVFSPRVWRFEAGVFVELHDPSIEVAQARLVDAEVFCELSDAIVLRMNLDLAGGVASLVDHEIRAQVVVERVVGPDIILDRLPDGPGLGSLLVSGGPRRGRASGSQVGDDGFVTLLLMHPRYPESRLTPSTAFPGSTFRVDTTGLFPNTVFKVFLGDVMVATGTTDGEGSCSAEIRMDPNAPPGPRLITVGNVGTALTADTVVDVLPLTFALPPLCPTGVSMSFWPPNHQYAPVDIESASGVTDPNGLPFTVRVTSITQDEPVIGRVAGSSPCDGRGVGTGTAEVRVERLGSGDGRVYHVHYVATNSADMSCSGMILVSVPHSQDGATAVDGGELFDSTNGCQ
jgi:hypothetical protein